MERIVTWIRNISPCNCAKIYWLTEMKQIKWFKENEKELEANYAVIRNRLNR